MTIALVGALGTEIAPYRALAESLHERSRSPVQIWHGRLFTRDAVIGLSGVGKVRAAMTAQHIIDTYQPTAVVMVGVAGALNSSLRIGDVILSTDCLQHDVEAMALGHPRGELPGGLDDRILAADPRLVALAMTANSEDTPVLTGRILSGDQFYTEEQTLSRPYLFDELAGMAIEMEGAALAAVCKASSVPFIVIRTICSELDGSQEDQFNATLDRIAGNTVPAVSKIFAGW